MKGERKKCALRGMSWSSEENGVRMNQVKRCAITIVKMREPEQNILLVMLPQAIGTRDGFSEVGKVARATELVRVIGI